MPGVDSLANRHDLGYRFRNVKIGSNRDDSNWQYICFAIEHISILNLNRIIIIGLICEAVFYSGHPIICSSGMYLMIQ